MTLQPSCGAFDVRHRYDTTIDYDFIATARVCTVTCHFKGREPSGWMLRILYTWFNPSLYILLAIVSYTCTRGIEKHRLGGFGEPPRPSPIPRVWDLYSDRGKIKGLNYKASGSPRGKSVPPPPPPCSTYNVQSTVRRLHDRMHEFLYCSRSPKVFHKFNNNNNTYI